MSNPDGTLYRPCRCADCRFFDGDFCRRHAPTMSFQLEDALIAMLQAIAQAQIQALSKDGHEQLLSAGTVDEDVWHSAQAVYHTRPWRHVTEDDWCGEHSPRVSHQEEQNVTPSPPPK